VGALFAAMGLVFVAELGDKTQLVALSFGARNRLAPVLGGLALGYATVNLLSVLIGAVLGVALPTRAIGVGGGILFLAFAAWTVRGLRHPESSDAVRAQAEDEAAAVAAARRSVVLSMAGAIFVAELGDKTMLATATLAAKENPVIVWFGATTGIILAGTVGVLLGRAFGTRLSPRVTQVGSAVLFTAFGIVLLVANA
jgi:putative Ca2+/H+ antiporter (TMEM165/GDT1 family)